MQKKTFIAAGFALVLFAFFIVGHSSRALAAWLIDGSGTLVQVDSLVLGDDSDTSGHDADETVSSPEPAKSPEVETENKVESEIEKDSPRPAASGLKSPEAAARQQKELQLKKETEKRRLLLLKKNVKKESKLTNTGKLEIEQHDLDKTGKIIKTAKSELPENESLTIAQPDGNDLEVKTASGGGLEVQGLKVRTRTHFPITIGADNALIITKKDGTQKTVTFLPDAAVAKLEEKGFVAASGTADLEEAEDGTPVYKFESTKEKKIFGLFKSSFAGETTVSAETGEVVETTSTETSPFRLFLERFAI